MRILPVGDRRVAIADAAEALREQVDVLLDRAADTVLNAPPPGSDAWKDSWRTRGSMDGRARVREHLLTRIVIAARLGLDTAHDVRAALAAGATVDDVNAQTGRAPVAPFASHRGPTRVVHLNPTKAEIVKA